MISLALNQVRSKAFNLSRRERAELAHDLLACLDRPTDEGVEQACAVGTERRSEELDSGAVQAIDADEVNRGISRGVWNIR